MAANCEGQRQMRVPRSPCFPAPKCPCRKCKLREQDLQATRGLTAANSSANANGICGQGRIRGWANIVACDASGLNSHSYGYRGAYATDMDCSCGTATAASRMQNTAQSCAYAPARGGTICSSCKSTRQNKTVCRCTGAGLGTGETSADLRAADSTDYLATNDSTIAGAPLLRHICAPETGCGIACGPATGCDASCNNMRGPVGVNAFGNEQLNFFITFLMEFMGILVFFAVCTVTFWMTIGYYLVSLLGDLRNADRNVQMVALVLVSLLLIAFAITLVTSRAGPCGKLKHIKAVSGCKHKTSAHSWTSKLVRLLKAVGQKYFSITDKKGVAKTAPKRPKADAKRGCVLSRRTYTDCEGRQIFQNSRRYSIPSEMKQPPTLLVWLHDYIIQLT